MEPATGASGLATLLFSEAVKEGEKAIKSSSNLAAHVAQVLVSIVSVGLEGNCRL
jgi:hypothetical protein